jgi:hypothetical protein
MFRCTLPLAEYDVEEGTLSRAGLHRFCEYYAEDFIVECHLKLPSQAPVVDWRSWMAAGLVLYCNFATRTREEFASFLKLLKKDIFRRGGGGGGGNHAPLEAEVWRFVQLCCKKAGEYVQLLHRI